MAKKKKAKKKYAKRAKNIPLGLGAPIRAKSAPCGHVTATLAEGKRPTGKRPP